ncbi:DUF6153 family protein [Streptomyces sp. NPDC049577]|uniref:DUF6153 family protein n=1 Tax=Streptomyces sp. NPDC049577 TaxID=3155153 RepID=UPI003426EC55
MREQHPTAVWCGRALLLAALLLGIVTMHTLGHPGGHGAPAHRSAMPHAASAHAAPAAPDREHATSPAQRGFDPSSVCLAVLGTGAVLLLLVRAVLRRRPAGVPAIAARFARSPWPRPPPPRHKVLARLSVLRV